VHHRLLFVIVLCVSGYPGAVQASNPVVDAPVEIAKTVWGSSTRALEGARVDAISRVYQENYWDCFNFILSTAEKNYLIFKKDEVKGYMVLMHIPKSVDTTEVGVFFIELGNKETRIEIASLSTNAKRIVARTLFKKLDQHLGLIPLSKEEIEQAKKEKASKPAI